MNFVEVDKETGFYIVYHPAKNGFPDQYAVGRSEKRAGPEHLGSPDGSYGEAKKQFDLCVAWAKANEL